MAQRHPQETDLNPQTIDLTVHNPRVPILEPLQDATKAPKSTLEIQFDLFSGGVKKKGGRKRPEKGEPPSDQQLLLVIFCSLFLGRNPPPFFGSLKSPKRGRKETKFGIPENPVEKNYMTPLKKIEGKSCHSLPP